MAWHLARQGRRFLVLDAAPEIGHTWRSRWDSLTLFTPAQYDALPGMPFPAPADTYPTRDAVADYLRAYAEGRRLPVLLNARVTDLRRVGDAFEARTANDIFRGRLCPAPPGSAASPTSAVYAPPGRYLACLSTRST